MSTDEEAFKKALEEPDDQSDDCDVICPYCKSSYQAEAETFSENEREETCFECKRVYLMHAEATVTYYTRPKPTPPAVSGERGQAEPESL